MSLTSRKWNSVILGRGAVSLFVVLQHFEATFYSLLQVSKCPRKMRERMKTFLPVR